MWGWASQRARSRRERPWAAAVAVRSVEGVKRAERRAASKEEGGRMEDESEGAALAAEGRSGRVRVGTGLGSGVNMGGRCLV
jgi:hypothetical protein